MPIPNASKRILLFQVFPVWRGKQMDMRVPLGMLYLGDSLKRNGYKVEAYHVMEQEIDRELHRIDLRDVLFIGVCSVMTGYSLRCAMSFSKKIKTMQSEIPIVWGGVQPSAIPEACLKEDFVDAVGVGEGEDLIVDIAKAYNGLMCFSEVKGLAFKDEAGHIVINPRRDFIKNLDDYHADYSLINLNRYIFGGAIYGLIMSSRGCPYNCAFCYNNAFNNRKWRKHSREYVINELKKLRNQYEISFITFSDDNFFADQNRAVGILEDAYKIGLRTGSLDIKINNLSEDLVKTLSRLEVASVFFGTESLNSRLLKLINKQQTKEMVIAAISKFAKYAPSISVQTEILMALPFQRMSELREDIRDGLALYEFSHNLSMYYGVLFPLPNTKMMKYANVNGFCPHSLEDYAQVDLNNVWSICDQWTLMDLTHKEKQKLYLTEKYSALIWFDRRPQGKTWFLFIRHTMLLILFRLAKFRLKRWFFLFYQFDFAIAKWVGLIPKDFQV
jgi:radical SAM superfamily enzyme YgiQ (UPF0313 family)